jgi:hypothetical protein
VEGVGSVEGIMSPQFALFGLPVTWVAGPRQIFTAADLAGGSIRTPGTVPLAAGGRPMVKLAGLGARRAAGRRGRGSPVWFRPNFSPTPDKSLILLMTPQKCSHNIY